MLNIKINGIETTANNNETILEVAERLNIKIPTLCHVNLDELGLHNNEGSCRICLVELSSGNLVPSCIAKVQDGMDIQTDSRKVIENRKNILELMLASHPDDCLMCDRNLNCELQTLANELKVSNVRFNESELPFEIDRSNVSIVRDPNKCILCYRCVSMCNDVQKVGAISTFNRGFDTYIGSGFDNSLDDTPCTFCGQCLAVCPTGALQEVNNVEYVWNALNNPNKHVVVQTAPAVRVAIGEMFGMEPGVDATGLMATALRRIGFDSIFDTNFAADLTILEEATEFLDRLENGGTLPIMTSCCPGWINFLEKKFPEFLDHPSSCKSPHEMLGPVIKTFYANQIGVSAEDIIVISVMPCVAKKYESHRDELAGEYGRDVDMVITTRELGQMIKEIGLDFPNLEESDFDNPLGESTGAASIFGASGGVLEATVRTSYEWVVGETLEDLDFKVLRGFDGIKEATVDLDGTKLKVAVAHGLGNAEEILKRISEGEEYHAVEVMACPTGCIGGAGQPYHNGDMKVLDKRVKGIYSIDKNKGVRKSHENKTLQKLYNDFLGDKNGPLAYKLLHTKYKSNPKY